MKLEDAKQNYAAGEAATDSALAWLVGSRWTLATLALTHGAAAVVGAWLALALFG